MLYLGVDLYCKSFSVVVLTEGFALLGKKYFEFTEHNEFIQWISKMKNDPHETCWWFFDELDFNKPDGPAFTFPFNEEHYDTSNFLYLVNHRKLINLIQFFNEWIVYEHGCLMEIKKAYILASSVRIFDKELISKDMPIMDKN